MFCVNLCTSYVIYLEGNTQVNHAQIGKWVAGPNFRMIPRGSSLGGQNNGARPKRFVAVEQNRKLQSKRDKEAYDPNNRPVLTWGQFKPTGKWHT